MSRFDLREIEQARKAGKQDEETAKTSVQDVKDAIAFLKVAEGETRAAKVYLKAKLAEAQECLTKNRLHENETVRREVWKGLISFALNSQISSYDDAEKIISQLVTDGFLEEDAKGALTTLGKNYGIPVESLFEDKEDMPTVREHFEGFKNRVRNVLTTTAEPKPRDLLWKPGYFKLFVPPSLQGSIWSPGVLLLIRSRSGFVEPLDGIGGLESGVYEAHRLGVKIDVKSLQLSQPPTVAFEKGDKEHENKNAKTQWIWYLINRGLFFDLWLTRTSAKANLNGQEFFLERKPGKYFLDYGESWEWKNQEKGRTTWLSRPTLLIERLVKDGQNFIRITDSPGHLRDFLKNCNDCYPEGERFAELPENLKQLILAMLNKVAPDVRKEETLIEKVLEPI